MRAGLTALVWTTSLVCVLLAGLIATEFVFMATSLDPSELVSGGVETWGDALEAGGAFAGLVVVVVVSLTLWHSRRFKTVGLAMTLAEVGAVAWACLRVYREYM